jgi:hypothetical protein
MTNVQPDRTKSSCERNAGRSPAWLLSVSVAVLAAVAVAAGVLIATWPAGLSPARYRITAGRAAIGSLVPVRGVLFGAWVEPRNRSGTVAEEAAVVALEHSLGRKLAIDQIYVPWPRPMPLKVARWDLRNGRVPMISWAGASAKLIASGAYDAQIRTRARQLRALHRPVMLRWFAEMDGKAHLADARSPTTFIAAWRHMHRIFASVGATNVRWVWCPNAFDFKTGVAQQYYPGSAYVDWIGADGYNWAPRRPSARWTSFGQIFSTFYRWGLAARKPLLVGEFGVLERAPGEKAAWFRQAEHELRTQFGGIRAVVYFDSDHQHFNWRVTTSRSAFRAFRAFAADPYFRARPAA